LLISICENLGGLIDKIVVNDMREGTYYAQLYLQNAGKEIIIDTRPSDAVVLALTTGCPLYITAEVAKHSLPLEEVMRESNEDVISREDDGSSNLLH